MSAWQHTSPKSGDQRKTIGGAVAVTRKHTLVGPNIAPLLNSWRLHVRHPAASVTRPELWSFESIKRRSSGEACVALLAFLKVTNMLTRSPSIFRLETHSV